MKKYVFLILIFVGLLSCGDNSEYNLEKRADAVRQHLKYRDVDNNTITKVEYLKALSFDKIPNEEREQPDEAYLCRVYIKGTWAYADSYRIFNINDTVSFYFSDKKTILRMDENAIK